MIKSTGKDNRAIDWKSMAIFFSQLTLRIFLSLATVMLLWLTHISLVGPLSEDIIAAVRDPVYIRIIELSWTGTYPSTDSFHQKYND